MGQLLSRGWPRASAVKKERRILRSCTQGQKKRNLLVKTTLAPGAKINSRSLHHGNGGGQSRETCVEEGAQDNGPSQTEVRRVMWSGKVVKKRPIKKVVDRQEGE